jgi:molybdopterin/thiamine biosynthesis adenylyltransferase
LRGASGFGGHVYRIAPRGKSASSDSYERCRRLPPTSSCADAGVVIEALREPPTRVAEIEIAWLLIA